MFEGKASVTKAASSSNDIVVRPKDECNWDEVSLGEVMLRLDPGDVRVATAREFNVWEGGGEYNVARGLRRCFGLKTAIVTALADNPVGDARRLNAAGRRRPVACGVDQVRWRRSHDAQRIELYRAWLWCSRSAGLFGPAGIRR